MTEIVYTRGWSVIRKKYAELYSEEHARELHRAHQPYTAVLRFDGVERCLVKMNLGFDHVSVYHLDEDRNPQSCFGYKLTLPERTELWLYEMIFFTVAFPDDDVPSKFILNRNKPERVGTWTLTGSIGMGPLEDVPGARRNHGMMRRSRCRRSGATTTCTAPMPSTRSTTTSPQRTCIGQVGSSFPTSRETDHLKARV